MGLYAGGRGGGGGRWEIIIGINLSIIKLVVPLFLTEYSSGLSVLVKELKFTCSTFVTTAASALKSQS